jgi:F-type H+-transporting ATPase subunit a
MNLIEPILSFGSTPFLHPFASAEGVPELPSWVAVLSHYFHENIVVGFLHQWEGMVFAYIVAGVIILVVQIATRNPTMVPGRLQNFVEWVVESLHNFLLDVIGPEGRPFVPFLATLFIYILCMNLSGTLPLSLSPTANANTTFALAICTFLYSNWIGLRKHGPIGYVLHFAGSPKTLVEWILVPINLPIHILGELARPVSLALRLFGNVTGEDVLLYAFCSLGVAALSFMHSPIGLPLQVPFIFLAFLTSFIQALVFCLLSTVYILLWLPHEEGH